MKRFASIFFAVALAACGGTSASGPATSSMGEHAHEGHEGGEHPTLTPEMNAFHDVLAPLWHAEPGVERKENTCKATAQLHELAAQIFVAAPAGADLTVWQQEASALDGALGELDGPCFGGMTNQGTMTFEDAFHGVHQQFHVLMELLPAG